MEWSRKATDRFVASVLYLGVCVAVVFAGVAVINHSLEVKFYKDYLLKWKVSLIRYRALDGSWPQFFGTNHVEYMNELVRRIEKKGINLPRSNTLWPYRYILDRIGYTGERIFILCFRDRILVYGMSQKTFEMIDKYIDGVFHLTKGRFKGRVNKNGVTITGMWGI